jgi:hypothetical protein
VPSTTNWALPYPSANDAPNGATQIAALASAVDTALESRKTLYARKAADTSRNTTTTHADDPDLTVTVAASAVYSVNCGLYYVSSSQTAGDFKAQFAAPASAVLQGSVFTFAAASAAATDDLVTCITLTTSMSCGVVLTGDPYNPCHVHGLLVTGGSSGAFKVQWAQNASSGTNTTLKANSYLLLQRLA